MQSKEILTAPIADAITPSGVVDKPSACGAFNFKAMKMIEYLGVIPTRTGKAKFHHALYECPFCGNSFKAIIYQVDSGHTKSCGCLLNLSKLSFGMRMKKHALSKHPLYFVFNSFIRCKSSFQNDIT